MCFAYVGSPHTSGCSSQPPPQQQTEGRGGFSSSGSESTGLPRATTNPTFGSSGSVGTGQSGFVGSGYGSSSNPSSGAYGSNSTRFSGAKSISSAQYFNEEERYDIMRTPMYSADASNGGRTHPGSR